MGANGRASKRKSATLSTSRKQWNVGMFPHERLQVRALMVALDRPSEADTIRFLLNLYYRDGVATGSIPQEYSEPVKAAQDRLILEREREIRRVR